MTINKINKQICLQKLEKHLKKKCTFIALSERVTEELTLNIMKYN